MGDKNNIYSWDIVHTSDEVNGFFPILGHVWSRQLLENTFALPPFAVRSYLKAFWLNSLSFGLCQSKQLPNLKLLLVNKQQNPCRPSRTSGNLQKTDFPQVLLSDADRVLGWETTWKARLWPWRTVVGAASKSWVDIPAPLTAERERQRQSGNVLSNDGEDGAGPARALMQGDRWTPLELYNLQS